MDGQYEDSVIEITFPRDPAKLEEIKRMIIMSVQKLVQ